MRLQKFIILDRDGVINFDSPEYIKSPNEWKPIPNSIKAIKILTDNDFNIIVITNQSAINRGLMSYEAFTRINMKMLDMVTKAGGSIHAILYCPHTPSENCGCRKPKNGLFEKFKNNNSIDLKNSWMIGDKFTDVEFGKTSNLNTILFDPSLEYEKETQNHYHAGNYLTIKKIIIENEKR